MAQKTELLGATLPDSFAHKRGKKHPQAITRGVSWGSMHHTRKACTPRATFSNTQLLLQWFSWMHIEQPN